MFNATSYSEFLSRMNALEDKDLLTLLIEKGLLIEKVQDGAQNVGAIVRWGRIHTTRKVMLIRCRSCKNFRPLFDCGFFEEACLPLRKILEIIFLWSQGQGQAATVILTNTNRGTVNQYFRYLRDIASWRILESPQLFQYGGPGVVVQIDESVITQRKYNRGRKVKLQWVLGIWDTHRKRSLVQYVEKRNAATLLPIIQRHVINGSEIWTDQWRAYSLTRMGYIHRTVNHSSFFKDPETGVCTNAVEGMWSAMKTGLRKKALLGSPLLPEHIDEWMRRQAFIHKGTNAFKTILEDISQRYPL